MKIYCKTTYEFHLKRMEKFLHLNKSVLPAEKWPFRSQVESDLQSPPRNETENFQLEKS